MDASTLTSRNLEYKFMPTNFPAVCRPPFTLTVKDTSTNVTNPTWLTAVSTAEPARIDVLPTSDYTLLGNHPMTVTFVPLVPLTPTSILAPAPAVVTFTIQFKCAVTAVPPTVSNLRYPIIGAFHISN
jgi:hypothetical protein